MFPSALNSPRPILPVLLALLLMAWVLPVAAQDSSDVFLRAYQDFQAGEKAERDGRPQEAYSRYQNTSKLLEQIRKSEPEWQPLVVDFRLKKTRENLERLASVVADLSSSPEGPEGPLPTRDPGIINMPPVVITTGSTTAPRLPAVTPRPSAPTSASTSEVASLRQQLSVAQRENERLQESLIQQAGELRSARTEIDRTKVNVVDLRAQLAQAQDTMENAISDRNAFAARAAPSDDKGLGELMSRMSELDANNEVLQADNDRLLAKLDAAAKYIGAADEGRKILETDRLGLLKQRDEAIARTKRIKDNAATLEKLADEKETLVAAFNKERKGLETKIAEKNDPERFKKLEAENKTLATQLADAETKFSEASTKPQENEQLLASLRSEINTLNDRLLDALSQVSGRDEQIKTLAKQLDEATGETARLKLNPEPTAEDKRILTESDLLRGIILRQIKEQSERDAARIAVQAEIEKLQVQSQTLTSQMEIMARPAFQLSPEERKLFKEPVVLLSESSAEKLGVDMAIAKPEGGFEPAPAAEGASALPEATHARIEEARKLFEYGRFDEAEKLYQQIVDDAPNNYFALSNLGVTQIQAHKLSAAEVALKKAISINPSDSFAATNLGIVYSKQGRFDEAIVALNEAVSVDAKDHIAWNYLGICMGEKGSKTEAEENFKRSIAVRDDYAEAHFNLAVLYATATPPALELAKQHYKAAVEHGAPPDPSLDRLLQ